MAKIPIKFKKPSQMKPVAEEMKVDLRRGGEKREPACFLSKKAGLILIGLLILLILGLSAKILLFAPSQIPFYEDLSKEAVVFVLLDQELFFQQALPFASIIKEKDFSKTLDKISQAVNRANLNFSQDIQMLFEKQAIFVLLPADSQTPFPFGIILKRLVSNDKISQFIANFELELKKDYDFSDQDFRQIKIRRLSPITPSVSLLYAQVKDYFVITSSQNSMREIISLLIGQ